MDYTTLQAVKTYSDTLAVKDDALIKGLVTAASRMVDEFCEQVFYRRTITAERCTAVVTPEGRLRVVAKAPTITAISALSFRPAGQDDWQVVWPDELEWVDKKPGAAIETTRRGYKRVRGGRIEARLSATLGWTADEIPADFEMAVRRLVYASYKRRETPEDKTAIPELGMVIIPQAWPPDVKVNLQPYKQVANW